MTVHAFVCLEHPMWFNFLYNQGLGVSTIVSLPRDTSLTTSVTPIGYTKECQFLRGKVYPGSLVNQFLPDQKVNKKMRSIVHQYQLSKKKKKVNHT